MKLLLFSDSFANRNNNGFSNSFKIYLFSKAMYKCYCRQIYVTVNLGYLEFFISILFCCGFRRYRQNICEKVDLRDKHVKKTNKTKQYNYVVRKLIKN